jgi:dipeptidyl aminopeptidase/acylaminoacyl peptidase
MKRWSRLFDKPLLPFAVVTAVAVFVATPTRDAESKPPRPAPHSLVDSQHPLQPAEPEYKLEDGQVMWDVNAPAVVDSAEQPPGGKAAAGKVDTLDLNKAYARATQLAGQTKGKVFRTTITPHWFADNTRFWYRNDTKDGTKDFVLVDVAKGTRQAAFDHEKLAASLSKATGNKYAADGLPFQTIEFADDGKIVRFSVGKDPWQCELTSYECTRAATAPKDEAGPSPPAAEEPDDYSQNSYDPPQAEEMSPEELAQKKGQPKKGKQSPFPVREAKSPDGKWTVFIKEFNVWLRDQDGKDTQVTQNGIEGDAYSSVAWSPDSKVVVTFRSTPGDNKTVYLLESSPRDQLPAKLHERPYPRPGDKFSTHEMWLIDVDKVKPIQVDVERIDFRGIPRLRWHKDNQHFTFEKTDRGHQRFRVIEVDAKTGKTRNILDEKAQTMVDHYSYFFLQYLPSPPTPLPASGERGEGAEEILYLSEMDGWKHLYLIDAKTGKMKQITKGQWVIRKIDRVDVEKRQVWFQASGKNPDQDPYLIHFYRVNFDGTGLVALTGGNGNHSIQYSPDGKYIIDTYSRVDMAPVHELRRVSDGTKVCDLDKADTSALEATGWRCPEVFVAKGRDGKTDIWGIVYRPQNYDPDKKYPVIEYIYAGPHSSHVPKSFVAYRPMAALAELGFIVVQIDGMGTGNRSRAFHDVCWKNLADAGFPDRILWIKALAQKYAYVDITRVGIYGTSAGGQNACGAVLFHPEFYKVAVAACGCHDNRLDKSTWNEAWMGLMGPHYQAQSNVTNAHKLEGKLLLIVGEMDTNVPPESTLRVVDALIKAKKDFDLIFVPGLGHSSGGPHAERRRMDFFVQHLLGGQPPNRNAVGTGGKGE